MDTFVTVLTVQYPQQLWIIKGKLESEGIECFVKDELTVQSYNLYSNAVGGVKLQVQQKDVESAVELLKELGYLKEEAVQIDLLTRINRRTAFIPFLKNLDITYRITIATLIFVGIVAALLYFIFKPTAIDELERTPWCVDKIIYKSKLIIPTTTGVMVRLKDSYGNVECSELMTIGKNKSMSFPGINSDVVSGSWKWNDDVDNSINVLTSSLRDVYEGVYLIEISNDLLILRSKTTVIYAHRDNFDFSL